MNNDIEANRFISRIYDGVVAPEVWGSILEELAHFVDARGVNLAVIDNVHSHLNLSASNGLLSPEDIQYYNSHLAQHEAIAWKILINNKAGIVFSDVELEAGIEEHLRGTPLADWVQNTLGCQYRAAIRLSDEKPWNDIITLQFAQGRGPIELEQRRDLELFAPHFSKAIELNRPFALLNARYQSVMAFLDKLDLGVAIVTPQCEVVLSNEEARRIFSERDGIVIQRNSRVQICCSDTNAKFLDIVRTLSETGNIAKGSRSFIFSASCRSGKLPYIIEIFPFGSGFNALKNNFSGIVMVMIDTNNRKAINPTGLDQLFNLTSAEFQIARFILDGDNTNDIAEKRNVSPETVRSQAKSILHKTGCQSRNDLLRLAVAANPPIKD